MMPRAFIETPIGRLAYCRAGSGRPIVLIHGSLVTADDMVIALMPELAQRYDVIAFDRPGHGASAQTPEDEGSPYAQAAMIAAGWTALGIVRPLVIGHSFGGAVALALAIEWGQAVEGVVALAPICFPEARLEHALLAPRAVPLAGALLAASHGGATDLVAMPLLRNMMFLPQIMPRAYAEAYPFAEASTPGATIADGKDSLGMWRALFRSAASYPSCQTPVRIMAGTHDIVVAAALHGLLAARAMPNAVFEWIAGGGHMIHHFEQPRIEEAVAGLYEQAGEARSSI